MNREITPQKDLIIFDEIQASSRALNSLKYFEENENTHHIAEAGSLLGVKLSSPGSFPVGKVNFLHLYPMTFMEFLDAVGKSRYRELIEHNDAYTLIAEAFHKDLIRLLYQHYIIGGMPEAVKYFASSGNTKEIRVIQQEIINSYILDFAKHAPPPDIPKLRAIWESIPKQLARENKKFIFSAVKKSARAREYEGAIKWLEDSGLILRAFAAETDRYPLKHYSDSSCFKVYALDIGLLGAMARSPMDMLVKGNRLFNEYEGAFIENYVAQQIVSSFGQQLYYWRSRGGKAEVDFLFELEDGIVPLEVKAGINTKSKSLKSYDMQFSPSKLGRANLLNFKKDDKIMPLRPF